MTKFLIGWNLATIHTYTYAQRHWRTRPTSSLPIWCRYPREPGWPLASEPSDSHSSSCFFLNMFVPIIPLNGARVLCSVRRGKKHSASDIFHSIIILEKTENRSANTGKTGARRFAHNLRAYMRAPFSPLPYRDLGVAILPDITDRISFREAKLLLRGSPLWNQRSELALKMIKRNIDTRVLFHFYLKKPFSTGVELLYACTTIYLLTYLSCLSCVD